MPKFDVQYGKQRFINVKRSCHLSIEGAESLVTKFDEYIQLLKDQNQINNFKN